jgi:carbamoyltransferase
VRLQRSKTVLDTQRILIHFELATSYDESLRIPVSHQLYELLMEADGKKSVGDLLAEQETSAEGATVLLDELEDLWQKRVVTLDPPLRR